MLKGTIIENSLANQDLLKKVHIIATRKEGDWVLHDVLLNEALVPEISRAIADGPWYIHLWQTGLDDFLILFKNKSFRVRKSDPESFAAAIAYGRSIGIPSEQLDFPTD